MFMDFSLCKIKNWHADRGQVSKCVVNHRAFLYSY